MVRSQPSTSNGARNNNGDGFDEVAEAAILGLGRLTLLTLKSLWIMARWTVMFPILSVPLIGVVAAAYEWGWPIGLVLLVLFAGALVTWRLARPGSFHDHVSGPVWKRWRRWRVYVRPWASTCALHGLTTQLDDDVLVPLLRRVYVGYDRDELVVRMLPGQSTTDWQKQSEAFAHAFGSRAVRVRGLKPGWVCIEVAHTDALATPVTMRVPVENVALDAVPVGFREDGRPWLAKLLGRHLLVAGATGAGKGSVVWSLLAGIACSIRVGVVRVWVIDPKGGMEFGAGIDLFDRFAYDTGEATLSLLRDAVTIMFERAARLRGVTRQLVPSVGEPLLVIIIDEIASLTAYITDRKVKTEVEQLLGLLLSQGRAVGISVIACVQDPSKDVLTLRQLIPVRIGLRMTEASQAVMVLGQAARDAGAMCELIPESLPGVGYVVEEGRNEVERVRAFHITDDNIAYLTAHYRPIVPAPWSSPSDPGAAA